MVWRVTIASKLASSMLLSIGSHMNLTTKLGQVLLEAMNILTCSADHKCCGLFCHQSTLWHVIKLRQSPQPCLVNAICKRQSDAAADGDQEAECLNGHHS